MLTENQALLVGYDRQCVTPAIGTWLGGYGNGPDRATIGKIVPDDDLYVTAIAITDAAGETIVPMTVDLVRMPVGLFTDVRKAVVEKTGLKPENIILCATHSHSSPDAVDGVEAMQPFSRLLIAQAAKAVQNALDDRKEAVIYAGVREVENLNFVRRYMKDGEFLGTNRMGDAHETRADNHLQLIRFVRKDAKDIVLMNWGAHPDHSKDIGGPSGSPEFHRGCSADYIYALRKTVEAKAGVHFAFFEAAAGNLNPISKIPGEHPRVEERAEREGVKRYIAYGETLADEVLALLDTPLTRLNPGSAKGTQGPVTIDRPQGVPIGSPEYNKAYAVHVVTFAIRTLEAPTAESRDAAAMLTEKFQLGDEANIERLCSDETEHFHTHALCVKVLRDGGKMPFTNEWTRECASAMSNYFGFTSGPYGTRGVLSRAEEAQLPPIVIPVYALSCGDIAFAGAPGEIFDTNGMEVKTASPFGMTFYCEMCGGANSYFPSALAWSHGGYEVDMTIGAPGSAERISEALISLLNGLKADV